MLELGAAALAVDCIVRVLGLAARTDGSDYGHSWYSECLVVALV